MWSESWLGQSCAGNNWMLVTYKSHLWHQRQRLLQSSSLLFLASNCMVHTIWLSSLVTSWKYLDYPSLKSRRGQCWIGWSWTLGNLRLMSAIECLTSLNSLDLTTGTMWMELTTLLTVLQGDPFYLNSLSINFSGMALTGWDWNLQPGLINQHYLR